MRQTFADETSAGCEAVDSPGGEQVDVRRICTGPNNSRLLSEFERTCRLLQLTDQPVILKLRSFHRDSDMLTAVFDRAGDRSLRDWLDSANPSAIQVLETLIQIGSALEAAHRVGLVHGRLTDKSIRWRNSNGCPVLDFAEWADSPGLEERQPSVDAAAFGRIIRSTFQRPQFSVAIAKLSPDETARLLQLTGGPAGPQAAETADLYALLEILRTLFLDALTAQSCTAAMTKQHPEPTVLPDRAALPTVTDVGRLLQEIDQHLYGEPSTILQRPVLPECAPNNVVSAVMSWNLASAPEDLWPHVVNTNRLNRAIGLPEVRYSTSVHPVSGVHRFGTIRLAGQSLTWEEHPFEWIEGRRMSVLRQFANGPFHWLVNTVELERLPEGNTRLRHEVRIAARHWLGKQLAKLETGGRCRNSLDQVYRRIDDALQQAGGQPQSDPFAPQHALNGLQRQQFSLCGERLIDRGVSPVLTGALIAFVSNAAPQEIARIRPLALADRIGFDAAEVIDACLLATDEGLLQLRWDLLCPTCRTAAEHRETLRQLVSHGHCSACDRSFSLHTADAIEMVFQVHPDLREADAETYCIGGPGHCPHVVAQIRLEPGERFQLELTLSPGSYLICGPGLPGSLQLHVQPDAASDHLLIRLTQNAVDLQPVTLRAGRQLLLLENTFKVQQQIRVERTERHSDLVTATTAIAMPRFRELFPGEVLSPVQPDSTKDSTPADHMNSRITAGLSR